MPITTTSLKANAPAGKSEPSAGQHVKRLLLERIMSGYYKPRERLIETDLAGEFKCSRGPVREAVKSLESEGYLVIVPRRGTFVADLTAESAKVIGAIRGKLEALCVRYLRQSADPAVKQALDECLSEMEAAARIHSNDRFTDADMRLHRTIWKAARHEDLFRILDSLRNRLHWMARQWDATSLTDRLQIHRSYLDMVYNTPEAEVEAKVERHFSTRHSAVHGPERDRLRQTEGEPQGGLSDGPASADRPPPHSR